MLCKNASVPRSQFFIIHLVNANVLAKQRRAERDRRRQIVAGLLQGAGATSTFLSKAAWMLLNFQDAIEEGVVITQGMGNEVEPDQVQALAAFNTGLNTVNELFGYGFFQLLYYLCYIITSNILSPFFFHITMFCAPSEPTFLVHSSIPSNKDLKNGAVPIFKIVHLRPDLGCKDLVVLSVACCCSYNSNLLLSQSYK